MPIRFKPQLGEKDSPISRLIDKMLTNQKFKNFFAQNMAAL